MIFTDTVDSKLLKKNPAGESAKRSIKIFLPDELGLGSSLRVPVIYYLSPWLRRGIDVDQWSPFRESFLHRVERLIDKGHMKPVVVVCPDLWTGFGGSQYVDSSFFGPHGLFLRDELPVWVEEKLPVLRGAEGRGIIGKSSGGFGALRMLIDNPGWARAAAALAPDLGFDLQFSAGQFAKAADVLVQFSESIETFYNALKSQSEISSKYFEALMLIGNGLFYSKEIKRLSDFRLPFDSYLGKLLETSLREWLDNDPLVCLEKLPKGSKICNFLRLDCGNRDQYLLHYGARRMLELCQAKEIGLKYHEFDGSHSGIDGRWDLILPELVEHLYL